MTSTSGPRVDPAPLFDLVTGFPPDDAVDVTVRTPLSLAVYMTMLESTGRAAELAGLRKLHIDLARESARTFQAAIDDLAGPGVDESARLRITHIVDERVPGVNGLRPHVHYFVGTTLRGGAGEPVDVDRLAAVADAEVLDGHLEHLVTTTTARCGLVWGATAAGREVVAPPWLVESTAARRAEEPPCRGPWPRHQILAGAPR